MIEARHDAGNVVISKDGGSEATAASGNTTDLTGTMRLGRSSDAQYFSGELAELVLYNVVPSAPDRAKVRNYFGTKYGITLG